MPIPVVALTVGLAAAMSLPLTTAAAPAVDSPIRADEPTYDTPAPTPDASRRPRRTPRPDRTAQPTEVPLQAAKPVLLAPARTTLLVGIPAGDPLGQAPLRSALEAGFFADAGFADVQLVEVEDGVAALTGGQVDVAVVGVPEALAAWQVDPTMRAIAGHDNPPAGGMDAGTVLLAAPGLVADEPATVTAFLGAYIRGLRELSDPAASTAALARLEAAGSPVDPVALTIFGPFDGGFGPSDDEGGLGGLAARLASAGGADVDLGDFVAGHTLNIAQAALDLPPNPESGLLGGPGVTAVTVGMPLAGGAAGPIAVALEKGYFRDAGFESVEVVDVEEPVLGVLQGELDFGVMGLGDAADAVSQGLPLRAIAGHQNYAADGAYGGDVLVASSDLVDAEGTTVVAFLVAYLRGLRDLAGNAEAPGFAPFDGGFGARDQDGGLGELRTGVSDTLGVDPDTGSLLADAPLELAQAWWGLPANPSPTGPTASLPSETETE